MKDKIIKQLESGSKNFKQLHDAVAGYRHNKFVKELKNLILSKQVERLSNNIYKLSNYEN